MCVPDGLIDEDKLVEIKCPYKCATASMENLARYSDKQYSDLDFFHFDNYSIFRGDNNFCLTITDSGRLKLKEDHPYYYQVLSINDFIFITALLIKPIP